MCLISYQILKPKSRSTGQEVKDKILEAYERMATKYSELIDHKPHNAYYDRPNTMALIGDAQGLDILDAACGPGKYAQLLIDQGARVTGLDLSPSMIQLAKERNDEKGTFIVHDLAEPLDMLEDQSFDMVVCALAMHYLQVWEPTIKEYHRVLRPNGKAVISIEHPFFEYTYFKSKDYFSVEHVKCHWNGFGGRVEVNSYRRPLGACIAPLTNNGFYIDELVEPLPVAEFEKLDPRHYQELHEFPAFMHLRAVKK